MPVIIEPIMHRVILDTNKAYKSIFGIILVVKLKDIKDIIKFEENFEYNLNLRTKIKNSK